MDNEERVLRCHMLYTAYKANSFHLLKRKVTLGGKLVRIEISAGGHVLVDFPLSDLFEDPAMVEILDKLQDVYTKKFEYYRQELSNYRQRNSQKRDGTQI